ncbi:MAG TPA: response regulator [Steroidobacteraceae bacterium]|jgi:two-component system phosphate regulon response regulator OmpR|nr:response regulator [Steroidobacteraceae bacterium]
MDRIRVLVLDDEPELRALLQRYLSERGFDVRGIPDASHLDRLLQREHFDVLVLDIMLPGEDGLSVCRRLRAQGESIPIIMLTARGDPVDRILGREMGADDYLPKPFDPRELIACINAQTRRQRLLGPHTAAGSDDPVRFGPFEFNLKARRLTRDGDDIELTSGEFSLLQVLIEHGERPLGRERLRELTRGRDTAVGDRSIDVQVMRLRRVLEDDPARPRYIQTVRSLGYVFVRQPDTP